MADDQFASFVQVHHTENINLKYRCSYTIRIFLNFTQCVSFAQVPETQNSLVIIISDSFLLFLHHSLFGSLILKYVVSVKVSLLFLRKKFKYRLWN